jgi:hypothetical protein
MSRKTNQLKKRLRMIEAHHQNWRRHMTQWDIQLCDRALWLDRRSEALRSAESKLQRETAASVRIADVPAPMCFQEKCVQLTIQPGMFVARGRYSGQMIDIEREASWAAEQIRELVYREVYEAFKKP